MPYSMNESGIGASRVARELDLASESFGAPIADLAVELVPTLRDRIARIELEVALDVRVAERVPKRRLRRARRRGRGRLGRLTAGEQRRERSAGQRR